MKIVFLTLLFVCIKFSVNAQTRELQVVLRGHVYDSLFVTGYNVDDEKIVLPGAKKSNSIWIFSINEKIWKTLPSFRLSTQLYDTISKTTGVISLACSFDSETVNRISTFYPDEECMTIYACFDKKIKNETLFVVNANDENILVNGYIEEDVFVVDCQSNRQLMLPLEFKDFSLRDLNKQQYDQKLKEFSMYVDLYPNSRHLITLLKMRYTQFQSPQQIVVLYDKFSENLKHSFWGDYINRRLHTKCFLNSILPLSGTDLRELIIKDSTKLNLVLFSASWCRPCIAEIPLLKKMYNDLKDKIEFTYISLDDKRTVGSWIKLMTDKEIPWRSLLSFEDPKEILRKYMLDGPSNIIVYPSDMRMEELDFHKETDIEKLYKLCAE